MIDRLPIATSFSGSNWKKSQWDSECERDLATMLQALAMQVLEPIGRHALNVPATFNDCWPANSWDTYSTMSRRHPGPLTNSGAKPPTPCSVGMASRCSRVEAGSDYA